MITNNTQEIILNEFKNWTKQHGQLSNDAWKESLKVMHIRKVKKGTTILKHNEDENYFRFIHSGIIKREFHANNRSFVNEFEIGPTVSGKVLSFTPNKISESVSLTTITPTILIEIKLSDIITLISAQAQLQNIALTITNKYISRLNDNICRIRFTTAEDYYLHIMKNRPEIIQYAKMEDIASYLNITPSSLSRIRKAKITRV